MLFTRWIEQQEGGSNDGASLRRGGGRREDVKLPPPSSSLVGVQGEGEERGEEEASFLLFLPKRLELLLCLAELLKYSTKTEVQEQPDRILSTP